MNDNVIRRSDKREEGQAAFDHDENHKEFNDLGAGKASDSEANEAEADMESITAEKVVTLHVIFVTFPVIGKLV